MTALITRDELAEEIEAGSVTVIDALGAEYCRFTAWRRAPMADLPAALRQG